jgi:hypothetical protein
MWSNLYLLHRRSAQIESNRSNANSLLRLKQQYKDRDVRLEYEQHDLFMSHLPRRQESCIFTGLTLSSQVIMREKYCLYNAHGDAILAHI